MEWRQFPLTGFDHTIPVTDGDVAAVKSLFPDCDPSDPPWGKIESELINEGGYHLYDICNLQCRRVVHLLRESRAARGANRNTRAGRPVDAGVAKRRKIVKRLDDEGMQPGEIAAQLMVIQQQDKLSRHVKVSPDIVKKDIARGRIGTK